MTIDIDPNCAAGIDCEGCRCEVYCPQRDDERKRRQSIADTLPRAWGSNPNLGDANWANRITKALG